MARTTKFSGRPAGVSSTDLSGVDVRSGVHLLVAVTSVHRDDAGGEWTLLAARLSAPLRIVRCQTDVHTQSQPWNAVMTTLSPNRPTIHVFPTTVASLALSSPHHSPWFSHRSPVLTALPSRPHHCPHPVITILPSSPPRPLPVLTVLPSQSSSFSPASPHLPPLPVLAVLPQSSSPSPPHFPRPVLTILPSQSSSSPSQPSPSSNSRRPLLPVLTVLSS